MVALSTRMIDELGDGPGAGLRVRLYFWTRRGRQSENSRATPSLFGPVANPNTKLLIYDLFQRGRVLAQDGVFVTIEVWSRLWPSTVTGRRSYRNTHALFRDLSKRMNFGRLPLIVTDGFEFYQKVIRRFFGPACLYGQVLKTRRNGRIIKVERRALHGAAWRFEDALNNSEVCLLFIHPRAPNLIGLRSTGTIPT